MSSFSPHLRFFTINVFNVRHQPCYDYDKKDLSGPRDQQLRARYVVFIGPLAALRRVKFWCASGSAWMQYPE